MGSDEQIPQDAVDDSDPKVWLIRRQRISNAIVAHKHEIYHRIRRAYQG
jgi:hypothetical protein